MKCTAYCWFGLLNLFVAGMLCGCTDLGRGRPEAEPSSAALRALREVKAKHAPDDHLAMFTVGFERHGHTFVLTGEVDHAEARLEAVRAVEHAGFPVKDRIVVLPGSE